MANQQNISKNKFDLTAEECKRVLDSIEGLVVVDENAVIRYLGPDMFERLEDLYNIPMPENVVGKRIEDVHPTSKIRNALTIGKEEDHIYMLEGIVNVARIKPIFEKGTMKGAIDYDLFGDNWQLAVFMKKIMELASKGIVSIPKTLQEMEEQYRRNAKSKNKVTDIIGQSQPMHGLRQKIYDLAESSSTVLILGETGTGKELVAHAIHNISQRKSFPLIEINCAAIPETLFESELFGYEEGSFTGALKGGRMGKFQLADKGAVFLDEIDQIPYHIQPKLLRVLQEREIDRIGTKKIPVDVRIIAATNKDLKAMVKKGTFREDLYYRLNVINMNIPPLRERKEDILELAQAHIEQLNSVLNGSVIGISREAKELLLQYEWPGNVRELFNIIERAMNIQKEGMLDENCFHELFVDVLKSEGLFQQKSEGGTLEKIVSLAEKEAIHRALALCSGNRTKTAAFLNISRPSLHYKIKKYELDKR